MVGKQYYILPRKVLMWTPRHDVAVVLRYNRGGVILVDIL